MILRTASSRVGAAVAVAVAVVIALGLFWVWPPGQDGKPQDEGAPPGGPVTAGRDLDSITLSDSQLAAVKVEPAQEREFPLDKEAVGSVDFNEYLTSQVFTPYQGRIIALFAAAGDDVKKGQTLFTVDSPDLLQANRL